MKNLGKDVTSFVFDGSIDAIYITCDGFPSNDEYFCLLYPLLFQSEVRLFIRRLFVSMERFWKFKSRQLSFWLCKLTLNRISLRVIRCRTGDPKYPKFHFLKYFNSITIQGLNCMKICITTMVTHRAKISGNIRSKLFMKGIF